IAVQKNLRVPMRDAVTLAADVYSGVGDEPRPALVALSPYGKELQALALTMPPQRRPSPMWDASATTTPAACPWARTPTTSSSGFAAYTPLLIVPILLFFALQAPPPALLGMVVSFACGVGWAALFLLVAAALPGVPRPVM